MGVAKLQNVLAAVAAKGDRADQLRALQLLQGFDHIADATVSVVTPMSQFRDDIALTAFGVLLKTKSADSVNRLERYLESYTANSYPRALFAIGSDLSKITDANALPALHGLRGSRFYSVQFGAMSAMRRIKQTDCVPILIQRLDDHNSDIRYVAVITLAEINGKYEGDSATRIQYRSSSTRAGGLPPKPPPQLPHLWFTSMTMRHKTLLKTTFPRIRPTGRLTTRRRLLPCLWIELGLWEAIGTIAIRRYY